MATPRVHRFAAPVVIGPADLPGVPIAVVVEPRDGGDTAATRSSIEAQSVSAAELLEGRPDAALHRAQAGWVAFVRAGDVLAPHAIERLGQAAALAPDAALLTCDDDALDPRGERIDPRVRPGPSPDLLLAADLTGALLCVDRERALAAGGPQAQAGVAWRYDLALTLAGAAGEGHAHVPMILVHRGGDEASADAEADAAAARALELRGEHGFRVERTGPGRRRVRRTLRGAPHVEVIVLLRDKPELLRRCARSLLDRSTYGPLTLRLVDNGSVEAETARLLAELAADPRVSVMADDRPFNFAALNNAAVEASEADVVVLLNNDTEVITESWAEELLEEAQRPEVGAVAPLLLYPSGAVQHAGAAIGLHGYAGHPFAGLDPAERTPFGSADEATRNWLAVTAACLMVERAKFEAVGGFDESFVVAGNDVDLCLRLSKAGHRSLCVPHVRMLHDESQSRGTHIDPQDFRRSEERYGVFRTIGDPFYSPNLTLARSDCSLRQPGEERPSP